MNSKQVFYQIIKAGLTQGYYIDIYVGPKLFKTVLATDQQDLGLKLSQLIEQFKSIGLIQEAF